MLDCRVQPPTAEPIAIGGGQNYRPNLHMFQLSDQYCSDQSSGRLNGALSQMSHQEKQAWQRSVVQADRLDDHRREGPGLENLPDPKRLRVDENTQQIGSQVFPPSMLACSTSNKGR